jgi:hypothetical protein
MNDGPDFLEALPLPGEPTDAFPGTERKIRILIERALRKEQLFHPRDGIDCPARHLRVVPKEESA